MIKNYFVIAWRSLTKNRVFSSINLIGLTIGMAGALLIFAWVQNELSYDQFHTNKASLYKLWNKSLKNNNNPISCWDVTTAAAAPALQQQYPEVKAFTRVYWPTDRLFNYGDKAITATGLDVDKPFLTMFSFPLLEGNPNNALDDINDVVLTQTLAKKIFGGTDPINKLIKINTDKLYKVTGVMADLPNNTQFDFEYLVSIEGLQYLKSEQLRWNSNSYNTYIQLKPGVNVNKLNAKIKNIVLQHDTGTALQVFLYPVSKLHLYSNFENGVEAGGRIQTVHLMEVIACLILIIACINFMNLSTARSEKRAKEVGVRKVIGATRMLLIKQFLIESILLAVIAGVASLIIVQLCLPSFNTLTGKNLFVAYSNPTLWLFLLGFTLLTGILAGSYPAFFLSAFKPINALKGGFKIQKSIVSPRKALVVVQFTVAIVLMIATLIIYKQIKYAQERNIGYNKNGLVEHPINGTINKNYDALKNELLNSGAITSICKTSWSITVDGSQTAGLNWGNMDLSHAQVSFSKYGTSGNFVKTAGLKLLAGRDIDINEYPADTTAVVLNEAALKATGFKDPIGQTMLFEGHKITVVGIIKDFILRSPYENIQPIIILGTKKLIFSLIFRLNPAHSVTSNLAQAANIFKKYNPAYPFQYQFVDEEYNQKFQDEVRTGTLAALFAGLTIVISCLGLFGLAVYMAESRLKEIGIRKVLGASINSIVQLLTKEFVALVIIAIIIAAPIGWYMMGKWLESYTYRISLSWLMFAATGALAIFIAVLTVSSQALKAALVNPAKTIKNE
jgi:putative ABC transport system permease protein